MLSSAISYASTKEKKKEWRTEGRGGEGGVRVRSESGNGGEHRRRISGPQWDKQKLHGNKERGAARWGEGRFGHTVHQLQHVEM